MDTHDRFIIVTFVLRLDIYCQKQIHLTASRSYKKCTRTKPVSHNLHRIIYFSFYNLWSLGQKKSNLNFLVHSMSFITTKLPKVLLNAIWFVPTNCFSCIFLKRHNPPPQKKTQVIKISCEYEHRHCRSFITTKLHRILLRIFKFVAWCIHICHTHIIIRYNQLPQCP